MRRVLLIILAVLILTSGCSSKGKVSTLNIEPYYHLEDWGLVSSNSKYLIQYIVGNDIKLFDIQRKELVKEIPNTKNIVGLPGFDMSDRYIVFSRENKDSADASKTFLQKNYDIFLYDLDSGEVEQITTESHVQYEPRVWKNYIVWKDNRLDKKREGTGEWSLYLYDINTLQETRITQSSADEILSINIKDNRVLWEQNNIIYSYNLLDNSTTVVEKDIRPGAEPDISNNVLVWKDSNKYEQGDVLIYNLETRKKELITDNPERQRSIRIDGKYIVWSSTRVITKDDPEIKWMSEGERIEEIYLYNLDTKKSYRLNQGSHPDIAYPWIVYSSNGIEVLHLPSLEDRIK